MQSKPKINVLVDSGAYSAWRLRKSVNLDDYCTFIENNSDWIENYVNLDVIIPNDPEAAAKASFDNLITMRARGLRPIPVIHVRESFDWLKRVLDLGCDYVGLAALSLSEKSAVNHWFEMAWSYLVDNNGNPLVKVHAFGDGKEAILSQFPWHSADSSSWALQAQGYGQVRLPDGQKMHHTQKIDHSRRKPDITMLGELEKQEFNSIMSQLGIDVNAFTERKGHVSYVARSFLAAHYFGEVEKRVRELLPIKFYPKYGLLSGVCDRGNSGYAQKQFYLYLAIVSNNAQLPALYYAGRTTILFSFFYDNERYRNNLRAYCHDPLATISTPPYDKYHTLLQGMLYHARI